MVAVRPPWIPATSTQARKNSRSQWPPSAPAIATQTRPDQSRRQKPVVTPLIGGQNLGGRRLLCRHAKSGKGARRLPAEHFQPQDIEMQRRDQQDQDRHHHAAAPPISSRPSRIGRCTSALNASMPTPIHQTAVQVP